MGLYSKLQQTLQTHANPSETSMDPWKQGLTVLQAAATDLLVAGLALFLFFFDRWQEISLLCARWIAHELHSWLYIILLSYAQYHIFCIRLFSPKYSVIVDPIVLMFVFSFCAPEHVLISVLYVLTLYFLKYTVHSCYVLFIHSLLPVSFWHVCSFPFISF